jgi:hypothetical protein
VVDDYNLHWLFLWFQSKPELLLDRSEKGRTIGVTIARKLSGDLRRQIREGGLETALFTFIGGPSQFKVIGTRQACPVADGTPKPPRKRLS